MQISWQESKFSTPIIIIVILIISLLIGQIISGSLNKMVLAAILVTVVVLVILVNTDMALAILIFSMLLSPEIVLGEVPGRDIVIRFEDFLLALIAFTWLAKTAYNKGMTLFLKTPLNKAIGLYLVVCVVSTLQGAFLGEVNLAKGFFYVTRYAEYFLLFILVANHVHSRKQVNFFLAVLFITCAIVSVYGILQIPTGRRISAPFEGEVGEPNTFGGYLLFIFCIALGIFLQNVSRRMKLVLLGLCLLIFIPFLFTLSRGSYLAFIFALLALTVLSKRKLELFAVSAVIILGILILRPESVLSRVTYTFGEEEQNVPKIGNTQVDPSTYARLASYEEAIKAWVARPIIGRGVSGFIFIDGQYIRTLPELGIIGLFALLWLLWTILKHSYRINKEMNVELYKGITLGFVAGFIGLCVHALTSNTFIIIRIMEPFWFMAGIVMMLPLIQEEERQEQE